MAVATRLGYDDLPSPHPAHRRREARAERVLDARRPLGALRPRAPGRPGAVDDPDRDRFSSRGHGPAAYYAVLAAKGFFPVELLEGFGEFDSPLGHHPDRLLVPGSRSRAARSGTASGSPSASPLRSTFRSVTSRVSSACSATPNSRRAATSRRFSSPAAGARPPHGGRDRQLIVELRLAGRDRAPLPPRGLERARRRRPRPRRDRSRVPGCAGDRHVVVAEIGERK